MMPQFDVDWEVWALPLSIAVIQRQFVTVRIGPFTWSWGYYRIPADK